jgi:hypothetical protein
VSAAVVGSGQVQVTWQIDAADVGRLAFVRVESVPAVATYDLSAQQNGSVVFGALRQGVAYTFIVRAVSTGGVAGPAAVSVPVIIPAGTTGTVRPPSQPAPQPPQPPLPQPPTAPGVPRPCVASQWPSWARGRPGTFATGAPLGAYLWFDGSAWSLRVFNPGGPAVFTGQIRANTRVSFSASGLERGDLLSRGRSSARFSFRSANDIDGIRIVASCATVLSIDVSINGQRLAPNQIFVGSNSLAPSNPINIVR